MLVVVVVVKIIVQMTAWRRGRQRAVRCSEAILRGRASVETLGLLKLNQDRLVSKADFASLAGEFKLLEEETPKLLLGMKAEEVKAAAGSKLACW